MLNIPALPRHCNSWIITKDGQACMETWSRKVVENAARAAKPGVEILTAADWLGRFNSKVAA